MASDGTIKITTELDNSQAEQAMSKLGKLVKTGIAALGISKIASEIGQLGGYILRTGLQFESAFAGVEKTVDATDEQLQEFRSGIREMSTEIPQTAADIASVAEAAGQLGIKNDYLLGFTETMSNLGVATNMSATEAATSLARLANITQMPQENFDRLGSTIVALGNNLATTESEITEMGMRLAGAGKQVGMSEAQILGLAGAISSVGIEADAGGSAISTVMTKMQLAVEEGGESLEKFAGVAGMSADEFRQAFQQDAAQALVSFVEGLGMMESRALGLEISMTDGVISNYQELQGQIQSLIQQKRVEAVMSAQQAKFDEAVAKQMQVAAEASANLTALKQAENDVKKESAELTQLELEYDQAVIDGNKALVSILEEKIKRQQEEVDSAKEAYEENKKAYAENSELLAQYANDIDMYTALAEAAASGNAEAIEQAISRITSGIKTARTATNEELQQQVVDVSNMEAMIRQEVEKGTPGFTQAMLTQAQDATTSALEEFAKVAPQTAAELAKVPPEAVAALVAGDMRGQLSAEASGAVEGMLDQFDGLDSETQLAFANAVYGALSGLEGFDQLADPAKEGADVFLKSLKEALEINSPSKAVMRIFEGVWPGATQGLESGQEELTAKGSSVIQSFLAALSSGGLIEGAMNVGQRIMQFFGLGVSSQSENSRAAGKANADAANAGAGSVNPSGTGSVFGSLFGSGVSGASGAARGAGSTLANNANAGAGSVNPSGTGSVFGSQYASGVGSKSGDARNQGVLLGNSAKGGASTADGSSAGSNFGAGFVRGISGWIGRAASTAAQLAKSALNAAKRALGIASPSKEMKKVGKWFGKGLEDGIRSSEQAAEASAKELSAKTLSAFDTHALQAKLQELDIPDVMSKIYLAVDDKQAQVAANMISAAKVREDLAWKEREKDQIVRLSDSDFERLKKEVTKISRRPIAVYSVLNGKVVAKELVNPMGDELNRKTKLEKMIWEGRRS